MSSETQGLEKKSLRLVTGRTADFNKIARECVGFANARGGRLSLGIEDDHDLPAAKQRIEDRTVEEVHKRIQQLTQNVVIAPRKVTASNGGQYIEVEIFPTQAIASMSDGRYFLRISDECRPLMPEDLLRLMNDKSAYVWETQIVQQVPRTRFDEEKRQAFLESIRDSERVTPFVKDKSDDEILSHYLFVKGDYLTNLGVLWVGKREDRASLAYAPAIQFIKYDEREEKVNKLTWDDFYLNPLELIEAVWQEVPDWRESYELPDGMFRRNVPHYPEKVIRELLANALAHRPYTQRGDISLNLYSDRLEIRNPGLLPLGVTPHNILHQSVARNPHLATVFRDLRLMEREGSGYDTMYDVLLSQGKAVPEVIETNERVTVIVRKRIINPNIVDFVAKTDEAFHLKQKERVTLGLLAQHDSLTMAELAKYLELQETEDAWHWLGRLPELSIVKGKGRTKGKEYFIEPELLRKLDFKGITNLRKIEGHRLRELIIQDLKIYKLAGVGEIHERIGKEIPIRKIRHEIHKLTAEGEINSKGEKKGRKYSLANTE